MFGLPSWAWRVIGYAVIVLTVLVCGMRIMSIWDSSKVNGYKAAITQQAATVKRVDQAQHIINTTSQKAETVAQADIVAKAQVVHRKVKIHVTAHQDAVGCVTWGMLRVHDAAVADVDPDTLQPPAGQSDDACSPIKTSDFMDDVAANYRAANQNAEQLNTLEDNVRANGQAVADNPPADLPLVNPKVGEALPAL